MISIDFIKQASACYFYETNIDKLKGAISGLGELLSQSWLNQENRSIASSLFLRLKLKALTLRYLNEGYTPESYQKLTAYLEAMIAEATEKEYTKTIALALRVRDYVKGVNAIMFDAVAQAARIRDDNWNPMAASKAEAEDVKRIFDAKIVAAGELPEGVDLFGEQVRFLSVRTQIIDDLTTISKFAAKVVKDMISSTQSAVLRSCERPLDERLNNFEYCPTLDDSTRTALAVVVCTPIDEECALFGMASSRSNPCGVFAIDAGALGSNVSLVFEALQERGSDCILFGIHDYRGIPSDLYSAVLSYGKTGKRVFIHDKTKDRRIYNDFLTYINGSEGQYSTLSITREYLSMPNFSELVELFESLEMFTDYSAEELRAEMPFMGFVGLNLATEAHKLRRDWVRIGREISRQNHRTALSYIDAIPVQAHLIDTGWGEFDTSKEDSIVSQRKAEFDTDKPKEDIQEQVRQVMQSSASFFAKCGMMVRICLLRGMAPAQWKELGKEEQEERLTEASQLLMHYLEVPLVPVVEVEEVITVGDTKYPNWGGVCCDGGKLIKYKEESAQNLEYILGCVCHECYHAFQHALRQTGWKEWHWEILGITKGTVEELRNVATKKYIYKGKAYRVQMTEVEARTFATNCVNEAASVWGAISWE